MTRRVVLLDEVWIRRIANNLQVHAINSFYLDETMSKLSATLLFMRSSLFLNADETKPPRSRRFATQALAFFETDLKVPHS